MAVDCKMNKIQKQFQANLQLNETPSFRWYEYDYWLLCTDSNVLF